MKSEEDMMNNLREDGFDRVYIWEDDSNGHYALHKHAYLTRVVIIEGEMKIKINEEEKILKEGNAINIERDEFHEVRFGIDGCRYIICERD